MDHRVEMKEKMIGRRIKHGLALAVLAMLLTWLSLMVQTNGAAQAQLPTGSIPTVTGSPVPAIAIVRDNEQGFANVRSGPGTTGYEIIGVLMVGEQVPALGRSLGGEWIMIAYPPVPSGVGWVYIDLVEVRGNLPIVEPPPTITPRTTPTIDPTLAAQFLIELPPTRLPTFTPPPPMVLPTLETERTTPAPQRVPVGLIITGLGVVGLFGTLLSFLRGR